MRKLFSFIAAVLFAGSMMATSITITGASGFKSSYGTGDTFTVDEVEFWYSGVMYNGKGTPEASAAKSFIQLRKSGSGAGEIKNNTELSLKSIVVATQNDKDFTLSAGTAADALNAVTKPAGEAGTYAFTDKNGSDASCNVTVYTFNVTGMKYFDLLNGANASYIAYITIELADGDTPPAPVVEYYVVGSMNNWELNADYKLAANPGQAGEYMKRFTFAANDELKVRKAIDGVLDAWYPEGMGNNWVINEAGQYDVYFRPEGNDAWANHYFYVAPYVIPQYEVAEAIAAGLTNGTEIKVRGVVSKMEIKGKNFANYGSACIYVSDATDQAGEFEFYNCLAIGSAKFTTTVPAYDATSTTWTQLTEVATADGYAIHVGDTVIAQGNYKLYNTTYELDQNCFIIYAKAPDAKYPTNIENAALEQKAIKTIENGKLVIIKNGVRYDALGTRL